MIAELGRVAVSLDVMHVLATFYILLSVHIARVPLVAECGDGIDAPVEVDAELGVAKPVRRGVVLPE